MTAKVLCWETPNGRASGKSEPMDEKVAHDLLNSYNKRNQPIYYWLEDAEDSNEEMQEIKEGIDKKWNPEQRYAMAKAIYRNRHAESHIKSHSTYNL